MTQKRIRIKTANFTSREPLPTLKRDPEAVDDSIVGGWAFD
jgi:hypothetical protein